MNLTIKINTFDRTSAIDLRTFKIQDDINERVNSLYCEIKKYGGKTFIPAVGDEIEVLDNSDKIFAGVILRVKEEIEGQAIQKFKVKCVDWGHYLDRQMVVERYTTPDQTVNDIIADILANYCSGFTGANVNCLIPVESITFNYIAVSDALQKLAEATNYSWYVDYDKDIHFFEKNSKPAPFELSDTNGNHIFKTLKMEDDLSQLRNKMRIRGGEIEGNARTELLSGNGTRLIFPLANKFAEKPTVKVGGGPQNVGIEYLDQEALFDCFWNFNEKYIRFKVGTVPPDLENNIDVEGIPLIPIIVEVQDDASAGKYGVYEFYKKDTSIKTVDEARQYAVAELEAYGNSIIEGGFETYETGLRSGQILKIQSTIRGIDDNFLIQSVRLTMMGPSKGIWRIKLATLRTVGIIAFLQRLLLAGRIEIKEYEDEVLYKFYTDHQTIEITEEISVHEDMEDHQTIEIDEQIRKDPWGAGVAPDWVLAPYFPVNAADKKRPGRLDISMRVY